jgi:hypothetical protein
MECPKFLHLPPELCCNQGTDYCANELFNRCQIKRFILWKSNAKMLTDLDPRLDDAASAPYHQPSRQDRVVPAFGNTASSTQPADDVAVALKSGIPTLMAGVLELRSERRAPSCRMSTMPMRDPSARLRKIPSDHCPLRVDFGRSSVCESDTSGDLRPAEVRMLDDEAHAQTRSVGGA